MKFIKLIMDFYIKYIFPFLASVASIFILIFFTIPKSYNELIESRSRVIIQTIQSQLDAATANYKESILRSEKLSKEIESQLQLISFDSALNPRLNVQISFSEVFWKVSEKASGKIISYNISIINNYKIPITVDAVYRKISCAEFIPDKILDIIMDEDELAKSGGYNWIVLGEDTLALKEFDIEKYKAQHGYKSRHFSLLKKNKSNELLGSLLPNCMSSVSERYFIPIRHAILCREDIVIYYAFTGLDGLQHYSTQTSSSAFPYDMRNVANAANK